MWDFLPPAAWGWLLCAAAVAGPEKFAGEVDALTKKPKPAPGHVLLVGSSTLRMWGSAAADLAPLAVENRVFGGSRTEDQLFYFDRLLDGLEPGLVVWYCGSNDVTEKKPVGTILRQTREWLARFRARHPEVPVLLVKVMRALSGVHEIDINPPLEVRPGEPREDLYQPDGLHLNERGYAEMVKVLRPRIEELSRPARHP